MDEELLAEEQIDESIDTDVDVEPGSFGYEYIILDESNEEITDPDLTLGYLKKEQFTVHHESLPELWHYKVVSFRFADGEVYTVTDENDPHVEIIDAQKGIFRYKDAEGESPRTVVGQTISPFIDRQPVKAWDEVKTFYRYVRYTEKELSDRDFLANGPTLLAEAQETIDELLLVIADLLGGAEEE